MTTTISMEVDRPLFDLLCSYFVPEYAEMVRGIKGSRMPRFGAIRQSVGELARDQPGEGKRRSRVRASLNGSTHDGR
jgi:hypothetical protein